MRFSSHARTALFLPLVAGLASAQAFNVDLFGQLGVPSPAYGAAAGQTGTWVVPTGVLTPGLVDTSGNPTGVTLEILYIPDGESFPANSVPGFAFDNPATTGDVQALMDDSLDPGNAYTEFRLSGMAPGSYSVYVYAWPPDQPLPLFVSIGSGGGFLGENGGTWNGQLHLETFAVECVEIAGPSDVIEFHMNAFTFASVNGFQVVPSPVPCVTTSRCNGDGGDGAGCIPCPCSNQAVAGTIGGCLNGAGKSVRLVPFGVPSASRSQLAFDLVQGRPGALAVLVSAPSSAPADPAHPCFGAGSGVASAEYDGLRCVSGGMLRHGMRVFRPFGNVEPLWGGDGPPTAGLVAQTGAVAGASRHFQAIFRDQPFAGCGTGLGTSQAVSTVIGP